MASDDKSGRKKAEVDSQKALEEFVRRHFDTPDTPQSVKDDVHALMGSHVTKGVRLQTQGLLREAIAESAKEHERPIKSSIDAEIVQTSYWHVGRVYRQLGELGKAIAALLKAAELLQQHHAGSSPYEDLAEIFIEQGELDKAIEMCQESLRLSPRTKYAQQLLDKAIELKRRKE
jgi:tetratricopeptide (TPR) repeat protein